MFADGAQVPSIFYDFQHSLIEKRTIAGHIRLAVTIYGEATIDFVHGGFVAVEIPSIEEPIFIAKQDVLFITYQNSCKIDRVELNHKFCVDCVANTGEVRICMPKATAPSPLYECRFCHEIWGQDLPRTIIDQV